LCLFLVSSFRTHQIRVHLKERRTPILGDDVYGNMDWNKKFEIDRPLLHAYETQFIHPLRKKSLQLVAPVPDDMNVLIKRILKNRITPVHGSFYDSRKRVLVQTTEVRGKEVPIATRQVQGGTPIFIPKMYVPSDRLTVHEQENEELW
jgi:hypothetical protein